jgi:hypothetical protein
MYHYDVGLIFNGSSVTIVCYTHYISYGYYMNTYIIETIIEINGSKGCSG